MFYFSIHECAYRFTGKLYYYVYSIEDRFTVCIPLYRGSGAVKEEVSWHRKGDEGDQKLAEMCAHQLWMVHPSMSINV